MLIVMKFAIGAGVLLVGLILWIRARRIESNDDDPTRQAALLAKLGSIPTDRFR
jgi:hypothetical protein